MRFLLVLSLLLVGCAPPGVELARLGPADSVRSGGREFEHLALAALIVLVLIPTVVKRRP